MTGVRGRGSVRRGDGKGRASNWPSVRRTSRKSRSLKRRSGTTQERKADKGNRQRQVEVASKSSFYNIAVERDGPTPQGQAYLEEVEKLTKQLADDRPSRTKLPPRSARRRASATAWNVAWRSPRPAHRGRGDLLRKLRTRPEEAVGWAGWFRSLADSSTASASPTKTSSSPSTT